MSELGTKGKKILGIPEEFIALAMIAPLVFACMATDPILVSVDQFNNGQNYALLSYSGAGNDSFEMNISKYVSRGTWLNSPTSNITNGTFMNFTVQICPTSGTPSDINMYFSKNNVSIPLHSGNLNSCRNVTVNASAIDNYFDTNTSTIITLSYLSSLANILSGESANLGELGLMMLREPKIYDVDEPVTYTIIWPAVPTNEVRYKCYEGDVERSVTIPAKHWHFSLLLPDVDPSVFSLPSYLPLSFITGGDSDATATLWDLPCPTYRYPGKYTAEVTRARLHIEDTVWPFYANFTDEFNTSSFNTERWDVKTVNSTVIRNESVLRMESPENDTGVIAYYSIPAIGNDTRRFNISVNVSDADFPGAFGADSVGLIGLLNESNDPVTQVGLIQNLSAAILFDNTMAMAICDGSGPLPSVMPLASSQNVFSMNSSGNNVSFYVNGVFLDNCSGQNGLFGDTYLSISPDALNESWRGNISVDDVNITLEEYSGGSWNELVQYNDSFSFLNSTAWDIRNNTITSGSSYGIQSRLIGMMNAYYINNYTDSIQNGSLKMVSESATGSSGIITYYNKSISSEDSPLGFFLLNATVNRSRISSDGMLGLFIADDKILPDDYNDFRNHVGPAVFMNSTHYEMYCNFSAGGSPNVSEEFNPADPNFIFLVNASILPNNVYFAGHSFLTNCSPYAGDGYFGMTSDPYTDRYDYSNASIDSVSINYLSMENTTGWVWFEPHSEVWDIVMDFIGEINDLTAYFSFRSDVIVERCTDDYNCPYEFLVSSETPGTINLSIVNITYKNLLGYENGQPNTRFENTERFSWMSENSTITDSVIRYQSSVKHSNVTNSEVIFSDVFYTNVTDSVMHASYRVDNFNAGGISILGSSLADLEVSPVRSGEVVNSELKGMAMLGGSAYNSNLSTGGAVFMDFYDASLSNYTLKKGRMVMNLTKYGANLPDFLGNMSMDRDNLDIESFMATLAGGGVDFPLGCEDDSIFEIENFTRMTMGSTDLPFVCWIKLHDIHLVFDDMNFENATSNMTVISLDNASFTLRNMANHFNVKMRQEEAYLIFWDLNTTSGPLTFNSSEQYVESDLLALDYNWTNGTVVTIGFDNLYGFNGSIYKYDGFTNNHTKVLMEGYPCNSTNSCHNISWDPVNRVLLFNVTNFSTYAIVRPECVCTNCTDCNEKLNMQTCDVVELNRSAVSSGSCLQSQPNWQNKIFSCAGHTIEGDGTGSGISMNENENNTIQDCTVTNFFSAVNLQNGSSNNTFHMMNISSNSGMGLFLNSSNMNMITNNTIRSNPVGINLSGSSSNLIYDNYFENTLNAFDQGSNLWNTSYNCSIANYTNIVGWPCQGGNYWEDYSGLDDGSGPYPHNTSGDGIGDTMIPYNSSEMILNGGDQLPLVRGQGGWSYIIYPEGVYERYAPGLPGTHLHTFYIRFVDLNATAGDRLECLVRQSDHAVTSTYSRDISSNLVDANISLNHTLDAFDMIDPTHPWKVLGCTLYDAQDNVIYQNSSDYDHHLNRDILVHGNNWTAFDSVDDDAYLASRCFLGIPKRYFNNSYYCDYVGDVAFAISMSTGFNVEGYCHDQVDNDGNGQTDCQDRYCRGIPYSCISHPEAGDPFYGSCTNGLCTETKNFGGHDLTYHYNRYVQPNGTLKVRFDGGYYDTGKPISYAIADLLGYNDSGYYGDSYILPDIAQTNTSYIAEAPYGHTGDIDMVLWVNLTDDYQEGNWYNVSIYLVHEGYDLLVAGIPIYIDENAESPWNESESGTYRSSPCSDSLDNDMNYYSDCADINCTGAVGGTDCTGGAAYCEYPDETTCYDCFDNNRDGAYDCGDADCDLRPGDYTNLSIMCNYFGEGNPVYDASAYPWTVACIDEFSNDQEDGTDCWDHTSCWGRGGLSTILPCPAFENNTAQWCHDNINNDYDSRMDCADYDCQNVSFANATYSAACPNNETLNEQGIYTPSQCFDLIDNDLDSPTQQYSGLGANIDCADPDCLFVSDPISGRICMPNEYNPALGINDSYCANSLDDDGDNYLGWPLGGIDCSDPDCHSQFGLCGPCPSVENTTWSSCSNSVDDDTNLPVSLTDCQDPNCLGQIGDASSAARCTASENNDSLCSDEFDNDANGFIDCLDVSCNGHSYCEYGAETSCSDQNDNDADGYTDCLDSDCYGSGACANMDWSSVSCTTVPHYSGIQQLGGSTISVAYLDRHYVDSNFTIQVNGSGDYSSVTVTIGDATDSDDYMPYNATNCTLSGDTHLVRFVASQEEVGQIQDLGSFSGGFSVTLECLGTSTAGSYDFPAIASNELAGGSTDNGEQDISTTVYENTAPSVLEVEAAPESGGTISIDYGTFFMLRGIPSDDPSGICSCDFNIGGSISSTNGICRISSAAQTDDGTIAVSAAATDGSNNAGSYGGAANYDVNVLPVVDSASIGKSQPFYNATNLSDDEVSFLGTFTTADSDGFVGCLAWVENETGDVETQQLVIPSGGSTATCSGSFDISGLQDGQYFLNINATDDDANTVSSDKKIFYVCSDNSSSGNGWDCAMADFNQDGEPDGYGCDYSPRPSFLLNLAINLMTASSEGHNVSVYNSAGVLLYENATSSGNHSLILPGGLYDIVVSAYGGALHAYFDDVGFFSEQNYSIYLDQINSTGYGLRAYTVSSDLNNSDVELDLSYRDTNYTDESLLEILHCGDWNMTTVTCNGTWDALETTVDSQAMSLSATVSSLSGFLVNQSEEVPDPPGGGADEDKEMEVSASAGYTGETVHFISTRGQRNLPFVRIRVYGPDDSSLLASVITTDGAGSASLVIDKAGDYSFVANKQGYDKYYGTFSVAEKIPEPKANETQECAADSDCAFDQACQSGKCTDLEPRECGYFENHLWHNYPCCEDADCGNGMICSGHECLLVPEKPGEEPDKPPLIKPDVPADDTLQVSGDTGIDKKPPQECCFLGVCGTYGGFCWYWGVVAFFLLLGLLGGVIVLKELEKRMKK